MAIEIVILAAGKGTRMKSEIPKVLHPVAGKPMIEHIYKTAQSLDPKNIHIIYGYNGDLLKSRLSHLDVNFIEQKEQLGTAHAVQQALPYLDDQDDLLVLYGDTVFIKEETLKNLVAITTENSLSVLTCVVDNPFGLGRIVKDQNGSFIKIVEQKDANEEELKIKEINTGVCFGKVALFKSFINKIGNNNSQKEFYLTDLFSIALEEGYKVNTYTTLNQNESLGINDHMQQAQMERIYQRDQADNLMKNGLTIIDPNRFDLRGSLEFGHDCIIDINVIIEGNVKLGNNVQIGAGCIIKDCVIEDGSIISPYSVLESSHIHKQNTIGPFARLRPGCELQDQVHVGNFVEVKNSKIDVGTKAGHLTYIGDSEVGKNVNFGAGTITCNYDGANKHKTIIGDDVFIGSDTQFVAPVEVKKGSTIGAGSTITKNINEDELVITRVPQRHIQGWRRPTKNKK